MCLSYFDAFAAFVDKDWNSHNEDHNLAMNLHCRMNKGNLVCPFSSEFNLLSDLVCIPPYLYIDFFQTEILLSFSEKYSQGKGST